MIADIACSRKIEEMTNGVSPRRAARSVRQLGDDMGGSRKQMNCVGRGNVKTILGDIQRK